MITCDWCGIEGRPARWRVTVTDLTDPEQLTLMLCREHTAFGCRRRGMALLDATPIDGPTTWREIGITAPATVDFLTAKLITPGEWLADWGHGSTTWAGDWCGCWGRECECRRRPTGDLCPCAATLIDRYEEAHFAADFGEVRR